MENLIEKFLLENGLATQDELLGLGDVPDWFFCFGKQKVTWDEVNQKTASMPDEQP